MSRLEQTQSQYRSLRLSATANHLDELLAQAEANELSYLDFAQQVAEHELTERTRSRIARHLKQAQLPA
ncbi:ATP-binding protein, partial [Marinimicrobium locisalis]|uniref:ATP-binding protein n=1 Tax=Marinimicrobium locisalis TaxID=546022 RepID=UPI003221D2DE